jgi:hypothetical protein
MFMLTCFPSKRVLEDVFNVLMFAIAECIWNDMTRSELCQAITSEIEHYKEAKVKESKRIAAAIIVSWFLLLA